MDLQAYDRLVDASPQGSFFCRAWWLDAVAPGQYEILSVEKAGEIQATWPIVWADQRKRSRLRMPPLTQKLGILFAPCEGKYAEQLSREHRLADELISQLPPGTHVDQHFHESFTNWLPFYWKGFRQTTRYTYVLEDLTDLDAIWSQLRNTVRTEIRKSQKRGLVVRETDDLEYFYHINLKSFARQGRKPFHTWDVMQRLDEACRNNAGRKILVAEGPDGQAHAAAYLVYDKQAATLLLTGADPQLRGSGAGPLLNWELIQFASTTSSLFDFEGSMVHSIENSYRGFGARQVPYFRIYGRSTLKSPLRRLAGRALRKLARIVDSD
jgi:hypothetical protein